MPARRARNLDDAQVAYPDGSTEHLRGVGVATTCDEWLPILAARLDYRYPTTARLRRYANGDADMPEMGKNLKASWLAFQKKARTDYGGLCVGSLADRLRLLSILVGKDAESLASVAARRVWRDNRMDVQLADVIDDYLTAGVGYLVDGDDSGSAVMTREMPEQFYAATDPLRPWKARAALKVWRDLDQGADFALVWITGERQKYIRPSYMPAEFADAKVLHVNAVGGWALFGEPEFFDGPPPVVVFERKSGQGLFEPHIDVIDRINLGKLQRLVTTAMQAFRQRALKADPASGGLPDKDADGHDIDYTKVFEPAPGALWELPAGIDVWESQSTDIRPLLEGEKADARDFAAVTRTPLSAFTPDGANQSATGATNSAAEQISQAKNEIARLTPGLQVALIYALRIEGVDLGEDTVEVTFENPAIVSMSEKYAAAAQAKTAGMTWDSIARTILGWSPEQIAQDSAARAGDALVAAMAFPLTTPAVPAGPVIPVAPMMPNVRQPTA